MHRNARSAAAWAAHLIALSQATLADKRTEHLPTPRCVLWLPERRAYLRAADLATRELSTVASADQALQLADEAASGLAGDLMAATGARVQVRAFCSTH